MTSPAISSIKKLTKRQQLVLSFIIDHIERWGYPPTIREIGDHLGIRSTNGVNDHLKALERKGYLTRHDAKSRALRPLLTPQGLTFEDDAAQAPAPQAPIQEIPIMGRIAAGQPISAIEHVEEIFRISQDAFGRVGEDIFGLVVKGDSMIEDGIHDGDTIFVRRQASARNGEIIAAMVDNEATVKRIYYEGDRIRLQPSNAAMLPIYVHKSEHRETCVLGRVVGVFRKL